MSGIMLLDGFSELQFPVKARVFFISCINLKR